MKTKARPASYEPAYQAVRVNDLGSFKPQHLESTLKYHKGYLLGEFHNIKDCLRAVRNFNAKQSLESPTEWAVMQWRNGGEPGYNDQFGGTLTLSYYGLAAYPAKGWKA